MQRESTRDWIKVQMCKNGGKNCVPSTLQRGTLVKTRSKRIWRIGELCLVKHPGFVALSIQSYPEARIYRRFQSKGPAIDKVESNRRQQDLT